MELWVVQEALAHHAGFKFAVTGVGTLATTYGLTSLLKECKFDWVFNTGIAGTFLPQLELGSAVVVKQEKLADFGVASLQDFRDIFTTGLIDEHSAPFAHGALNCPYVESFPALEKTPKVKGLTVSTLLEDDALVQERVSRYNAEVESMEGVAFFYVCLRENVKFLQLRGISNRVGERDKTKWKTNDALAAVSELLKNVAADLKLL
jgi:futalosine hydrolase